MWKSSAVVHVKAIINRSSVAVGICGDFAKNIFYRCVLCSVQQPDETCNVACLLYYVCLFMNLLYTRILHSNLPPDLVTHALSHPPFKTRAVRARGDGGRRRERMKIALALFFANAANLIVCNDASLHRARREEDHNGRDGESSENDVGSGIDEFAFPSPIPLRFSFLATDGGAKGGLRYNESSIPALELAIEHINANSSILPDYNLTFNLKRLQVKYRIIVKLL